MKFFVLANTYLSIGPPSPPRDFQFPQYRRVSSSCSSTVSTLRCPCWFRLMYILSGETQLSGETGEGDREVPLPQSCELFRDDSGDTSELSPESRSGAGVSLLPGFGFGVWMRGGLGCRRPGLRGRVGSGLSGAGSAGGYRPWLVCGALFQRSQSIRGFW